MARRRKRSSDHDSYVSPKHRRVVLDDSSDEDRPISRARRNISDSDNDRQNSSSDEQSSGPATPVGRKSSRLQERLSSAKKKPLNQLMKNRRRREHCQKILDRGIVRQKDCKRIKAPLDSSDEEMDKSVDSADEDSQTENARNEETVESFEEDNFIVDDENDAGDDGRSACSSMAESEADAQFIDDSESCNSNTTEEYQHPNAYVDRNPDAPLNLCSNTTDQKFRFYVDVMIAIALQPSYLQVTDTFDSELSNPAIKSIDSRLETHMSTMASSAWSADFKYAIQKYPDVKTSPIPTQSATCEACNRQRQVSVRVSFGGLPYDQKTLYPLGSGVSADDDLDEKRNFRVGAHCWNRAKLYRRLYHWRKLLLAECREKAYRIVLDRDDESGKLDVSLEDTRFLQKRLVSLQRGRHGGVAQVVASCLRQEDWVGQLYDKFYRRLVSGCESFHADSLKRYGITDAKAEYF